MGTPTDYIPLHPFERKHLDVAYENLSEEDRNRIDKLSAQARASIRYQGRFEKVPFGVAMSKELIAAIGRAIVLGLFDAGIPARSEQADDDSGSDVSNSEG